MPAPVIIALTPELLKAAALRILDPQPGDTYDVDGATEDLRQALMAAALSTGQQVEAEQPDLFGSTP